MPVLDIRALSSTQLEQLSKAYDDVCDKPLKSLPEMATDDTRKAIDDAIASVLGLPDYGILRTLLSREPVITMKKLGRKK